MHKYSSLGGDAFMTHIYRGIFLFDHVLIIHGAFHEILGGLVTCLSAKNMDLVVTGSCKLAHCGMYLELHMDFYYVPICL